MNNQGRPFSFTNSEALNLKGVCWGSEGDGIIFSPGNGLTVQSYRPAFGDLPSRTSIKGLNHRGHGGGDAPAAFQGWEELYRDLRDFISQTIQKPVIVAGHSMGAILSLFLAVREPELVKGLLMMDPVTPFGPQETSEELGGPFLKELIERTRSRRSQWPSREEAEQTLSGKGIYKDWQDEPFHLFLDSGLFDGPGKSVSLACPPWLEAEIFEKQSRREIWEYAPQVGVDTVILRGENSLVSGKAAVEALADEIPVATVITVKGDHTFPQENPSETAEALAEAWNILSGPGKVITD